MSAGTSSPSGTVARTSGAWRVSAATNSRSITESSGTSSSTSARPLHRPSRAPATSAARRNSAARSSTAARSNSASTLASSAPMSRRGHVGRQAAGANACKPQLVNRSRQRRGKPGQPRHRREVREVVGRNRVKHRPRRHRLGPRLRRGCAPRSGWGRDGHARRQLREAEPRQAERRASGGRDRANEVVRRASRGADDDRFSRGRKLFEKRARRREPGGRRCGGDNAKHESVDFLPDAVPDTRATRRLPRLQANNLQVTSYK